MNKLKFLIGIIFLINTITYGQTQDSAEQIQKLQELAEEMRQKTDVPGLAMAIVKNGEVIMSQGFGNRDLDKNLPVTPKTVFTIASASKAFTTASIGILVDEGKLDWYEPVKTFLPDFSLKDPVATNQATLLDLVTHRVGLPRHEWTWYGSDFNRKELMDRLKYLEPSQPFRSTWQYQNLMYVAAGHTVGEVSGTSWENVVQEKILDPLGMSSTFFSVEDSQTQPDYALPYRKVDESVVPGTFRNVDAIAPAGSITSSLEDMIRWVRLHLKDSTLTDKPVISVAQLDKMHSAQVVIQESSKHPELTPAAYGMGWFVYYYRGHKVVQHGGNLEGFTSLVYMLPDDNLGMVFLTNMDKSKLPSLLSLYASDFMLSLPEIDWYDRLDKKEKEEEEKEKKKEEKEPVSGTAPHHPWNDYAGTFEHPAYGKLVVEVESDTSLTTHYNSITYQITHWHYDVFRGFDHDYDDKKFFNYRTNNDGEIETVEINFEPSTGPIVFKKNPPDQLKSPEFLALLVGKYLADKLPIAITLKGQSAIQITPQGQPTFELEPYRGTEYRFKGVAGYSIEFLLDDGKKKVLGAKLHQPNGIFEVERL